MPLTLNALFLNLKNDTVTTVSRARKLAVGDPMPRFEDTPEGSAPPTRTQNAMLRARARKALARSATPARKRQARP